MADLDRTHDEKCNGSALCSAALHVHGCHADTEGRCDDPADPRTQPTDDGRVTMTHDPHPFHIVGECQECCDTSEALRMGYPDHIIPGCETQGCVNNGAVHV